ncbi:MAG TPA: M57 family metalloprotease [Kofleriaceae bacterium]|jgi:hypothetical protein|nr:M57 family metalloprotease [Kofleriaceae bacterium]
MVIALDDHDRALQRAFDETLAIVRGETAPWSASPVRDRTFATLAAPPSCLHQPVDIRARIAELERGRGMFTKSILLAMGCSTLAFGCVGNSSGDETRETIDNLVQAGFPANDIQVVDGKVYVGNDAEVSLQASREMLESGPGDEQYRTNNLVGGPTPSIICVGGGAFSADATLNAGLNGAIDNYNQLFQAGTIRLFFFRVPGGPIAGCNFFINGVVVPGLAGGQSGFPSGGAPFDTINIGDGVDPFGAAVAKHVTTHEIGHTIGFRHSDFFNRSISCGVGGNEGDGGVGAILIPGTPSGAVVGGSIMNSCFNGSENGLFTASDITAIDFLY